MLRKTLITLLVLAIAGSCMAYYLFNMPHKKVENATGIAITATQLENEFNSNEDAANARYLNKALEVAGTVQEVDKNQEGGIMIVLQTADALKGVQCAMRDKQLKISNGRNVVIKGFCSDFGISGVTLTDCIMQ